MSPANSDTKRRGLGRLFQASKLPYIYQILLSSSLILLHKLTGLYLHVIPEQKVPIYGLQANPKLVTSVVSSLFGKGILQMPPLYMIITTSHAFTGKCRNPSKAWEATAASFSAKHLSCSLPRN